MSISPQTTVGDLASAIPHAARVFETHRIDYCCGGRRSLQDACTKVGADVSSVVAELEAPPRDVDAGRDWRAAPLNELVAHIIDVHHAYMWQELPRVESLMIKVARVHGEAHPELRELQPIVLGLVDELNGHLMKEERVLFPYVTALGAGSATAPHFGTVQNPIRMMNAEHEGAGHALERVRRLTSDHTPPAGACGSYRALFAALAEMELDLHQHIHLESNVLFPRAVELEAARNSPTAES
jgi:regulator of cell morphogenesis and NO signaling